MNSQIIIVLLLNIALNIMMELYATEMGLFIREILALGTQKTNLEIIFVYNILERHNIVTRKNAKPKLLQTLQSFDT